MIKAVCYHCGEFNEIAEFRTGLVCEHCGHTDTIDEPLSSAKVEARPMLEPSANGRFVLNYGFRRIQALRALR